MCLQETSILGQRHLTDLFDVNTKAALGAIHSGLGHTAMNKFLKVMNIPSLSASTFKRYEREMGPVIETVAKESCNQACDEERALTLARLDELRKRLPQGVDSNFLTPDRAHRTNCHINVSKEACAITQDEKLAESVDLAEQQQCLTEKDEDNINRPVQDNSHNSLENSLEINEKLVTNACLTNFNTRYNEQESTVNTYDDVNNNELVRVFGTFDVGWDTRSSGHAYDSLCGTGHVFGPESGKVMACATRNRACRMCDLGHPKTDHDCRLNYFGTAERMEPELAVELFTNNPVMKEKNIEFDVFVGDNDSSSICAIRKVSNHSIIKHSDKNHTSKGVKSLLYKIEKAKDPEKELNSHSISYLHKCFTYAMTQHRGNAVAMSASIKNIPYHAFNIHDNCGDWCGYVKNKENYEHSTLKGGIKNKILVEELKSIFGRLANNADTFVSGVSTQVNESLNKTITSKAPKAISYGSSESQDYRVASAIAQRNIGEQYVQDTLRNLNLSPGSHLSKHVETITKSAKIRSLKAKMPKFKLHRHALKRKRSQLKYRQEEKEGLTYESNVGLLKIPAFVSNNLPLAKLNN